MERRPRRPGAFALPRWRTARWAPSTMTCCGEALGGANRQDWFLRSDFVSGGGGGGGGGGGAVIPPPVVMPVVPPVGAAGGGGGALPVVPIPLRACPLIRRRTRCRPASSFRSSGPNSQPMGWCSLWRANWGSASSARSTTGGATLTSRTVAPFSLRSRRIACRPGSRAATKKPGLAPCPLFSPSVWGRFFGQTVHNRYSAFADPRADGNLGGFQGGIDLLRGPLIPGGYDRAGLYGAYGDVNSDVDGLVTNPAATAYVLNRTGSMNLDAWSAGGYWTHVGPGGWYLDAVLQGTWYYGSASTQFAKLNTDGTGFIASLEGGYPFSWPQLGPGFVIEPQGQILWLMVSFRHDYDGLGDVALGDTTGPSGRIGLRTKWTIATAGGQVWQTRIPQGQSLARLGG